MTVPHCLYGTGKRLALCGQMTLDKKCHYWFIAIRSRCNNVANNRYLIVLYETAMVNRHEPIKINISIQTTKHCVICWIVMRSKLAKMMTINWLSYDDDNCTIMMMI